MISLTAKSQVKHVLGVDGGPSIFGYVTQPGIECNLHYYFNYKPFLFKTSVGVTPNTNFGTLTQLYTTIGFTTPLEKIISAHIVYGIGKTWVGREEFVSNDNNGDPTTYSFVYLMYPGLNPIVTSGLYINLFKKRNFIFGVDASISRLGIENYSFFAYSNSKGSHFVRAKYINSKPFAFNFALSYVFKKQKQ